MRIERIRIEGFGTLSNLDVAWPEGHVLLVVDHNETGKTTFCEAIVAALYGLPKGRVGAGRTREMRRPKSGAPLKVGLDLVSEGVRWSVDRDLDTGNVRIVDRDRGLDVTREFLRGGGRDVFGEKVTGLTELLLRTTAYVSQNVLDRDALDATLTVELARIADSGGGEASVVKALKVLDTARREMPEPTTGSAVSVDTEASRLAKRAELLRAERARLGGCRSAAAEASARLADRMRARDAARRRVAVDDLKVVVAEQRSLIARLAEVRAAVAARRSVETEAETLARDAEVFSREALAEIERLLSERGRRPEALRSSRAALEGAQRSAEEEGSELVSRFGAAAALADGERMHLAKVLQAVVENRGELAAAEDAVQKQWEELSRDGLAEDLRRLEALGVPERAFLQGAEEERTALELEGIRLDRKTADAAGLASIAVSERAHRVKWARGLVLAAAILLPAVVWLALPGTKAPSWMMLAAVAFDLGLGLSGAIAWVKGARHRLQDEVRARDDEAASRKRAVEVRRKLSDVRLRLDRIARGSGFADGGSLLKAHRRVRAADEKRRALAAKSARRDAALERGLSLETELAPVRDALGLPDGPPSADTVRGSLARLEELDRSLRALKTRASVRASEEERLFAEASALTVIEEKLREAMQKVGVPASLPLAEALLVVEGGRRRASRRKELVEVELPARREAAREEEIAVLQARLQALDAEVGRRLAETVVAPEELEGPSTPEEARRSAEEARVALGKAEEARLAAERELAAAAREGGERAREVEEELADVEAREARAVLFRAALDLARDALTGAASSVYGDFRRGLSEASRTILANWRTPYEALEFADDLSVSAVMRGGRLATRTEIDGALSTGAREQLHLTARLAALRYLGTGSEGVPLLLDDPLIGADDDRFVAVMQFLATHVLAERPVLLVSCHGWRHERLLDALPPAVAGKLTRLSLAPFSTRPAPAAPPTDESAPGLEN